MRESLGKALTFGTYRQAELQAFSNRLADAASTHAANPNLALSGNREFWRTDAMVHQRPGYYTSVKTISTRTAEPETVDEEGLKSMHTYGRHELHYRTRQRVRQHRSGVGLVSSAGHGPRSGAAIASGRMTR